ncbi:MAG: DUF6596 domain-containing protein [Polyangiaceae bacterium]
MSDSDQVIRDVLREQRGSLLARLIRVLGSFELAEDALQEALTAALTQWPAAGVPDNPRAWLLAAARHKGIDEIRRRELRGEKHVQMALTAPASSGAEDEPSIRDDMLRLMFTCCHPALAVPAQVALTLNTIAGLSVEEIARAFLVPVPTLAQRLVRAKRKIAVAGIPYSVPGPDDLSPRTEGILRVIYLTFNEGYTATRGSDLIRGELCDHALRLAHELMALLPGDGNVAGLLALMLLQDSRRSARTDEQGELVLLEHQDRSLWDVERIAEGRRLTRIALELTPRGSYALQAAIAALHAEANRAEDTDWPQIVALYTLLLAVESSAVVALNRAVALAMAQGAEAGLAAMVGLDGALKDYHLYHAAKADLLRRANRLDDARRTFERALELCDNEAEQRLLARKLALVSH